MIKRITDLNGIFLRDDFIFDEETERALDVEDAQGLYRPRWNGEEWVEDMTQEELEELKSEAIIEPTLEERISQTESKVITLEETIDTIFGGTV